MNANRIDVSVIRAASAHVLLAGFVAADGGADVRKAAMAKISKPPGGPLR